MSLAERRGGEQDGIISVVLALAMALFVVLLAAVIDLGQLQSARTALTTATSSAAQRAATVLAREGCDEFDLARAAASVALTENSTTATISAFEVRYGVVTVTSVADCLLVVTDQNVGQVQVTTADTRTPIFSAAFTDKGLSTAATTTAEWGYVSAMAGGMRPLSLCTSHPAYVDYQLYLAQVAAYEANPLLPAPDATLIDPFDVEVDAFVGTVADPITGVPETGFCPDAYGTAAPRPYGDLVNIDFTNSSGTQATLAGWLENGAPYLISLDDATTVPNEADCGDGASNDSGECEGVSQGVSSDRVADFLPIVDTVFTIALHDTPRCHNGNGSGHCSSSGARHHRAYPLSGFARVQLLCARITAYPTIAAAALVPDPDASSPTYGSDCVGLPKAAFVDGSPGDDVFVRLQFLVDSTIGEGHIVDTPLAANGFLGISICAIDGDDNCRF